jgi:hypothetical protein
MQIPLAFADPAVIEEVSLPLWRELFDALGWPASLLGKSESLTHDMIVSSFRSDALSDELLQAIETVHDLGTPEGRETISALLADRQIPSSTLPQGVGERELALRLFLSQRSDGALAEVFSRAQIQIQEGNHRRFNDFIGKKPKQIQDQSTKYQALERAILDHCRQEDLGNYVQLRVLDNDDDGACRFQIMRSHHMKTPLAVMDGSASRAKIQYRPVHADFVRYEPPLGRLRITARAPSIVQFYRKVFGGVLFEDETFFDGPPVCSLSVLQERGRSALTSHNVFGVGRVWMTECIWERGDRERLNLFAADCFDSITDERIMAWIMDTYSMNTGFSVPGVVTGKPVSIGGSLGRGGATSRGVVFCTLMALKQLGMKAEGLRVAIQGFGKVGGFAAQLFHDFGCNVVAVSDYKGGVLNNRGLNPTALLRHRDEAGTVAGFPGSDAITNDELLGLDIDVLVPAALEDQITQINADGIKAKIVVEGANGPTTPEADRILAERGVLVVPDILANAGGVTVSYFEWVQDIAAYFWSEDEVNARLRGVMEGAYESCRSFAEERGVRLRLAALSIGIGRVAEAHQARGLFP